MSIKFMYEIPTHYLNFIEMLVTVECAVVCRWSRWAGPLQRKTGNLDQLLGDFLDKQGFSDPRMEQAGGDNTRCSIWKGRTGF